MGNIASLVNIIHRAGGLSKVCSKPSDLAKPDAIILPGVGSFDNSIEKLKSSGFIDILHQKVLVENIPFLGICVGMQLLFEHSEEGILPGLGWLKGDVVRFNFSQLAQGNSLKIPHMGWNDVYPNSGSNLFAGLEQGSRFYFVHSFHVSCEDSSDILALSEYGYRFTSAIQNNNIYGVQFHPEKSHRFGVKFFQNFLNSINHA